MMEGTQDGNLPSGVAVNNTYVQPTKSGRITVCLQNTNDSQSCGSGNLFTRVIYEDVDKEDWEYEPVLVKDAETNNITVKFQQVHQNIYCEEILLPSRVQCSDPTKQIKIKKQKLKEKEKESDPQPTSEDSANKGTT